jgi:hypothetical protein
VSLNDINSPPPQADREQPLASTMGHIMSATLRRQAATLELAAIVESRDTPTVRFSSSSFFFFFFFFFFFLCTYCNYAEKATERLLQLIEDQDYEVRALAIKFAAKALQSDESLL